MNATVSRGLPTWLALFVFTCAVGSVCAGQPDPTSRPVSAVLREPLPPEEISLSESATGYLISGPTFTYRLEKATGAITGIRVVREAQEVVTSDGPADIQIDQYRLASDLNSCKVSIVSKGKDKVVLRAEGILRDPGKRGPEVDYALGHTFFNDGVAVTAVKLIPRADCGWNRRCFIGFLFKAGSVITCTRTGMSTGTRPREAFCLRRVKCCG